MSSPPVQGPPSHAPYYACELGEGLPRPAAYASAHPLMTVPMAFLFDSLGISRPYPANAQSACAQVHATAVNSPVAGLQDFSAGGRGSLMPYLTSPHGEHPMRPAYALPLLHLHVGAQRKSESSSAASGSLTSDGPSSFQSLQNVNPSTFYPPGDEHTNALLQSLMSLPAAPMLQSVRSTGSARADQGIAVRDAMTVDDLLAEVQAQTSLPATSGANGPGQVVLQAYGPIMDAAPGTSRDASIHFGRSTAKEAGVLMPPAPPPLVLSGVRQPRNASNAVAGLVPQSAALRAPEEALVATLFPSSSRPALRAQPAAGDAPRNMQAAHSEGSLFAASMAMQTGAGAGPMESTEGVHHIALVLDSVAPGLGPRPRRRVNVGSITVRDTCQDSASADGMDVAIPGAGAFSSAGPDSGGLGTEVGRISAPEQGEHPVARIRSESSGHAGEDDGDKDPERTSLEGHPARNKEAEDEEDEDGEDETTDGEDFTRLRRPKKRAATQRRRHGAGSSVSTKKELCRERNRTAQRRFRERQKDLIRALQEKVGQQETVIKNLTTRLAIYEGPPVKAEPYGK